MEQKIKKRQLVREFNLFEIDGAGSVTNLYESIADAISKGATSYTVEYNTCNKLVFFKETEETDTEYLERINRMRESLSSQLEMYKRWHRDKELELNRLDSILKKGDTR